MVVQTARAPALTRERLAEGASYLVSRDEDLARLFETDGVPPLWARRPGFPTLVHMILEQQVSLASARAVYQRLIDDLSPFTADRVLEAGVSHLRSLGVTRQKSAYCVNVAAGVVAGTLSLGAIGKLPDHAAADALQAVTGIGPWTADVYLLMALRRPDIWPLGDIALINTLRKVKRLRTRPSAERQGKIAENWRPFRSVAARMLWNHYLSTR